MVLRGLIELQHTTLSLIHVTATCTALDTGCRYYSPADPERLTVSSFVHQELAGGLASRGDLDSEHIIFQVSNKSQSPRFSSQIFGFYAPFPTPRYIPIMCWFLYGNGWWGINSI